MGLCASSPGNANSVVVSVVTADAKPTVTPPAPSTPEPTPAPSLAPAKTTAPIPATLPGTPDRSNEPRTPDVSRRNVMPSSGTAGPTRAGSGSKLAGSGALQTQLQAQLAQLAAKENPAAKEDGGKEAVGRPAALTTAGPEVVPVSTSSQQVLAAAASAEAHHKSKVGGGPAPVSPLAAARTEGTPAGSPRTPTQKRFQEEHLNRRKQSLAGVLPIAAKDGLLATVFAGGSGGQTDDVLEALVANHLEPAGYDSDSSSSSEGDDDGELLDDDWLEAEDEEPATVPEPVAAKKEVVVRKQNKAFDQRVVGSMAPNKQQAVSSGSSAASKMLGGAIKATMVASKMKEGLVRIRQNANAANVSETTEIRHAESETGKKTINQYEFIRTLGEGAYGKVKLAVNTKNKNLVAIKILKRRNFEKFGMAEDGPAEMVKAEIAIMKKLRHENITILYVFLYVCIWMDDHDDGACARHACVSVVGVG